MNIIKPKRLQKGHTIGLIAPASHFDSKERIQIAVEVLESLGFQVKKGFHLYSRYGYFAGNDEERAADISDSFNDPSVDGLVCLTGGWGSSRILPYLDFEVIQNNPKVLLGFSDITSLLNGIYAKTGIVTFHGLVADMNFSSYSLEEFNKVVMLGESNIFLGSPNPIEKQVGIINRKNRVSCLFPGIATGQLIGGNLTLISHLIGTPYLPDFNQKILFLEEVNEEVYRIDRMLTQIKLSGKLKELAGIVFGKFTRCDPSNHHATQFTLEEILENFTNELGIPAVTGLMFGHYEDQTTLPIGCNVELDANHRTLKLLEAAVES